jgi:hypothetical protein
MDTTIPAAAHEIIATIFGEQGKKKAYMAVLAAMDSQQKEIVKLKGFIETYFKATQHPYVYMLHDGNNMEIEKTLSEKWEQFKADNNIK